MTSQIVLFNQAQTINKPRQLKEMHIAGWAFSVSTQNTLQYKTSSFSAPRQTRDPVRFTAVLEQAELPNVSNWSHRVSFTAGLFMRKSCNVAHLLSFSPFFCSAERSLQTQDTPPPSNTACDNIRLIFTSYKSIIYMYTCIYINVTTQMHTLPCAKSWGWSISKPRGRGRSCARLVVETNYKKLIRATVSSSLFHLFESCCSERCWKPFFCLWSWWKNVDLFFLCLMLIS